MSTDEQLEKRIAALESAVDLLRQEVAEVRDNAVPTKTKWWENLGPRMTKEQQQAFDEVLAYGRYFRQTEQDLPPDWRPGDPIPEIVDES